MRKAKTKKATTTKAVLRKARTKMYKALEAQQTSPLRRAFQVGDLKEWNYVNGDRWKESVAVQLDTISLCIQQIAYQLRK